MHYGEAKPPIYNISNIPHDLPIFISYGGQDALSDVRDVQLLLDGLKFHDVDKLMIQYIKDYAHADFIMGINAKDIVFNQIVKFFKNQLWSLKEAWSVHVIELVNFYSLLTNKSFNTIESVQISEPAGSNYVHTTSLSKQSV